MTRNTGASTPFANLHAKLTQRQHDLEAEISSKVDEAGRDRADFDSGNSTDSGDDAQVDALGRVYHAEVDRDVAELNDVAAALGRIAQGSYGTCIACGETIDEGRLSAWPTAKRCTPCQRQRERLDPKTSSL